MYIYSHISNPLLSPLMSTSIPFQLLLQHSITHYHIITMLLKINIFITFLITEVTPFSWLVVKHLTLSLLNILFIFL